MPLNVLVACEYSGKVRDAFAKLGHNAMSCDLLPSDSPDGNHYKGDVSKVLNSDIRWDLLIGHPPCTFLSNSGVSWLHKSEGRWGDMRRGARFFKYLWESDIKHIAIENPIMHGYAKKIIGGTQSQVVQPFHFGHKECKATCLWLKNLPDLVPTDNVKDETMALPARDRQRLHYLPPSPERAKLRSETYQGLADAMAVQWSAWLA